VSVAHTVVKVCGLTTLADARMALEAGADWLGFIVGAGGARDIGADATATIARALPGVVTVAVMARVTPAQALELAGRAGTTRVQIHGIDAAAWPADFPLPAALAAGIDAEGRLHGSIAPPPHLVHLDTARGDATGGTGLTFPWPRARDLMGTRPFMLAGGLDGDNVARAIAELSPYGVDASSRLESAPGTKDPGRVRAFVNAVRTADARNVA
jgi:phosphoribosylanthranilate isomerase